MVDWKYSSFSPVLLDRSPGSSPVSGDIDLLLHHLRPEFRYVVHLDLFSKLSHTRPSPLAQFGGKVRRPSKFISKGTRKTSASRAGLKKVAKAERVVTVSVDTTGGPLELNSIYSQNHGDVALGALREEAWFDQRGGNTAILTAC